MKMMIVSLKTVAENGGRFDANAYVPGGRPYGGRLRKGEQWVTLYAHDHATKRAWRFYASENWLRNNSSTHCPTCNHVLHTDEEIVENRALHGFTLGEHITLEKLMQLRAKEVSYEEFMSSQRCAA